MGYAQRHDKAKSLTQHILVRNDASAQGWGPDSRNSFQNSQPALPKNSTANTQCTAKGGAAGHSPSSTLRTKTCEMEYVHIRNGRHSLHTSYLVEDHCFTSRDCNCFLTLENCKPPECGTFTCQNLTNTTVQNCQVPDTRQRRWEHQQSIIHST